MEGALFPYMVGDGAVGNYSRAFEAALEKFAAGAPERMAADSGASFDCGQSQFVLCTLGRRVTVSYPQGMVRFAGTELLPVWDWRLIILNYLGRADGTELSGRLVSYRQLEGGQLFYPAFLNNAIRPLAVQLSGLPGDLVGEAAGQLQGQVSSNSGFTSVFSFLPRFPVTVNLWPGDEEVAGSANILFDASANHYLHTEDIAGGGRLVASFLIRQCRALRGAKNGS